MTQLPEWAPAGLDVTRPSAARIYDYSLGGAHDFESDRQLAELVEAQRLSVRTATELTLRPHAGIASDFGSFELVEPGLVHIGRWRPARGDEPDPHPERLAGYAGVGRKG